MEIASILTTLFLLSIFFTGLYRRYALSREWLDHPNHRSSHSRPTPRGGGVVFCALFLVSLSVSVYVGFLPSSHFKVLGMPALIIAVLGYCDDVKGLPAALRFAMQIAAAVLFLYMLTIEPHYFMQGWLVILHHFGFLLFILAIVWSTNLYNFMDGTDGIAAVEAMTVYGVGGVLLWMQGASQLAYLAWMLVAGVCGFLVWNWPCAKIFMGDVASSFLGFLIIPFALLGYFEYGLSIFVWFILYLSFTLDATLTLLRRLWHKDKIYEAHKLHAYQRLHQAGYSHQYVLCCILSLNSIFSALALVVWLHAGWMPEILLCSIVIYLCFYVFVEIKKPMYPSALKVANL